MISGLIDTTETTTLGLDAIRIDGGTQMRAGLDEQTVQEYTAVMQEHGGWGPFPPVVVFYDGDKHWLGDGFHRIAAMKHLVIINRQIRGAVPAEVRPGTRRDAILHAAQANATHGLRRTNADKRRSVSALLNDDEWAQWSNYEIARRCHVSESFVRSLRGVTAHETQSERKYTTKHGTVATMDTERIGMTKPTNNVEPPAERREVNVSDVEPDQSVASAFDVVADTWVDCDMIEHLIMRMAERLGTIELTVEFHDGLWAIGSNGDMPEDCYDTLQEAMEALEQ